MSPRPPRWALWPLAAVGYAIVLALFWFRSPAALTERYLGEPSYGSYQETLWWFHHVAGHLNEPSAWFFTDIQKYPWGIEPHVLYAVDFLVPLLAAPFSALLPAPLSINGFLLVMLAGGSVAAFASARGLGSPVWSGLLAGLLFACAPYLHTQLLYGRLSLVLLFPLPLFLWSWVRAQREPGRGWLLAAVLSLAVAGWVYPYYAMFLALAAPLLAIGEGAPWRRLLRRTALVVAGAGLLLLPLALALVSQWSAITAFANDCQAYAPIRPDLPTAYCPIFFHSLWLHHLPLHLSDPLLAVCVVGLFVPGRPRRWSLVGLAAIVLALGPYLVGPGEPGRAACMSGLPLPFLLFRRLVPLASGFSHPYRLLALPMALGAVVLADLLGRLAGRFSQPVWGRGLVAVAGVAVLVSLALRPAIHLGEPLSPVPGLASLGDGEAPLILLPLDESDYLVHPQIAHGRPTLNGDGLGVRHKNPPELQALLDSDPLLRFLESVTREGALAPVPPASADRHFRELGYRHVVLCTWLTELPPFERATGEVEYPALPQQRMERARAALEAVFGPPSYQDEQITAFELR